MRGEPGEFVQALQIADPSALVAGKDSAAPGFDVAFFPEGGHLINGLPNQVAFKAIGSNGSGVKVTGILYDELDTPLTTFQSNQFGLGSFFFKPEKEGSYYAKLQLDSMHAHKALPPALDSGYLLQIRPSLDDITVMVQAQNKKVSNCKLIFYTKNEFLGFLSPRLSEDHLVTHIPVEELPPGIVYFTLLDEAGVPQCERLVYVYGNLIPDITTNKALYQKRDSVKVEIKLSGEGHLSSIASAGVVNALVSPANGHTIQTYLQLTSNLNGPVENPLWYFENKERYAALDYVMLTHGWRKFRWEKFTKKLTSAYAFSSEQGFSIGGQLVDFYNREKPVQGEVMLALLENPMYNVSVTTGEDGRFLFTNCQFTDSVTVVLQAKKLNKRGSNNLFIAMNQPEPEVGTPDLQFALAPYIQNETDSALSFQKHQDERIESILAAFEGQTILLDEMAFTSRRSSIEEIKTIYGEPSRRYDLDSLPYDVRSGAYSMMQVLSNLNIPGFNVNTLTMRGVSSLNADNTVTFFVDGILMQPIEGEKGDFLNFISPTEVARVDVLTGAEASMYGSIGSNGVIAIYTKGGGSVHKSTKRIGIIDFSHPGYYEARTFYSPRYNSKNEHSEKPDFRHTLHWEPNLMINEKGEVEFDFFTSDEVGNYQIELQGITRDGLPFYQTAIILTE